MDSVVVKARAKINPALDILGTRPDGYHELRMIMQTLRLHDSLLIQKTDEGPLMLVCNDQSLPTDERNLVYQAAQFLIREHRITQGVYIRLHKRIPVAAGLAGGSSDCAAVLKGMNRLFSLRIPMRQLQVIGGLFGSDVPFCLQQGTVLAEGKGEKLTHLPPHPPCWVALARIRTTISTRAIFTEYDSVCNEAHNQARPDIDDLINALTAGDLLRFAAGFGNVLTGVTARHNPAIERLISRFKKLGALNAAMTGSGPTVFAYFSDKETAKEALNTIKREHLADCDLFLTSVYNV